MRTDRQRSHGIRRGLYCADDGPRRPHLMLQIKVPPLGESIVQATISRWMKREGDAVQAGDTLVELETDKVTVEVPALKAGVLVKQDKKEGDVVGWMKCWGGRRDATPAAADDNRAPRRVNRKPPKRASQAAPHPLPNGKLPSKRQSRDGERYRPRRCVSKADVLDTVAPAHA